MYSYTSHPYQHHSDSPLDRLASTAGMEKRAVNALALRNLVALARSGPGSRLMRNVVLDGAKYGKVDKSVVKALRKASKNPQGPTIDPSQAPDALRGVWSTALHPSRYDKQWAQTANRRIWWSQPNKNTVTRPTEYDMFKNLAISQATPAWAGRRGEVFNRVYNVNDIVYPDTRVLSYQGRDPFGVSTHIGELDINAQVAKARNETELSNILRSVKGRRYGSPAGTIVRPVVFRKYYLQHPAKMRAYMHDLHDAYLSSNTLPPNPLYETVSTIGGRGGFKPVGALVPVKDPMLSHSYQTISDRANIMALKASPGGYPAAGYKADTAGTVGAIDSMYSAEQIKQSPSAEQNSNLSYLSLVPGVANAYSRHRGEPLRVLRNETISRMRKNVEWDPGPMRRIYPWTRL